MRINARCNVSGSCSRTCFVSITGMVDKMENTFVILFAERIPDSGVDLLFGRRGIVGRAVNFSSTGVVVVVGRCKGD